MSGELNRPLQVAQLIATRSGDADRGPLIFMNDEEARRRMLLDGELVRITGPRRTEFATLVIDNRVLRGEAVLRDLIGAAPSELIRVHKPEWDIERPRSGQRLA